MKIGYLKKLGVHELTKTASNWKTLHNNDDVILVSVVYDEVEDKIQSGELDAVLVNSRKDIFKSLESY